MQAIKEGAMLRGGMQTVNESGYDQRDSADRFVAPNRGTPQSQRFNSLTSQQHEGIFNFHPSHIDIPPECHVRKQ